MTGNSLHARKAALEEHYAEIFARLREQDIEQFYARYQLWVLRRRASLLEEQLETLREHLVEHRQVSQSLQPSALALAVLARLQSNGVTDIDLLDILLDRGEDWLDRMMQRLDYCEQVEDFIQGDYTQWCIRSLEGAYDWIDTLLGSIKDETRPDEPTTADGGTTEALLLQKLSTDDEESPQEVTQKQPTISSTRPVPTSRPADENEPSPELLSWQDLENLDISIEDEDETGPIHPPAPIETIATDQVPLAPEEATPLEETTKENQETVQEEKTENITIPAKYSSSHIEEQQLMSQATEENRGELSTQLMSVEEKQAEEHTASPEILQETSVPTEEIPEDRIVPAETTSETLQDAQPEQSGILREKILPPAEKTQNKSLAVLESIQKEQPEQPETLQTEQALLSAEDFDPQAVPPATGANEQLSGDMLKEPTKTRKEETSTGENHKLSQEMAGPAEVPPLLTEHEDLSVGKPREPEKPETGREGNDRNESQSAEIPERVEILEEPEEKMESTLEVFFNDENLPVEIPEEPETREEEEFSERYRAEQELEIEMAAIVNDILSVEEEQDEQLPWYEYLDLRERGAPAITPRPGEEQVEPEETTPDLAAEKTAPPMPRNDTPEPADVEPPGQANLPTREVLPSEKVTEIEGWQTWHTAAEEETLPFALKDLQHDKEGSTEVTDTELPKVQETRHVEPGPPIAVPEQEAEKEYSPQTPPPEAQPESTTDATEIAGPEHKSHVQDMDTTPLEIAGRDTGNPESKENGDTERIDTRAGVPSRPARETGAADAADAADTTNPRDSSNPTSRTGGTFKPRVVRTDIENVAIQTPGAYPPRKRSFWQRLFGFWRKGKGKSASKR